MKQLISFIQEKLKIKLDTKINNYNYFPKNNNELKRIIKTLIKERGNEANLNDIDVSQITDMSKLFEDDPREFILCKFNGDISEWDVSNVENMGSTFYLSSFNGDISKWDVSNVDNTRFMFRRSLFNKNISNWNVSKVKDMQFMFNESKFNQDISKWDVSNVESMQYMFAGSVFNQDISDWDVSNVVNFESMFENTSYNKKLDKWNVKSARLGMKNMFKKCPLVRKPPIWYKKMY